MISLPFLRLGEAFHSGGLSREPRRGCGEHPKSEVTDQRVSAGWLAQRRGPRARVLHPRGPSNSLTPFSHSPSVSFFWEAVGRIGRAHTGTSPAAGEGVRGRVTTPSLHLQEPRGGLFQHTRRCAHVLLGILNNELYCFQIGLGLLSNLAESTKNPTDLSRPRTPRPCCSHPAVPPRSLQGGYIDITSSPWFTLKFTPSAVIRCVLTDG